jgi:colanic acid biosynthesis glycosyl transferase WcaI
LKHIVFKPYQPREQLTLSLAVPVVHLISLQPSMESLILPSKFYSVAMAGRPTIFIGGKNGEISRILQEAQCGFSVEKDQAEVLSQVIRKLADHLDRCLSLGTRASAVFGQRFEMRHAMSAREAGLNAAADSMTA